MPRRFDWKQDKADELVNDFLSGKIPSARNLYHQMKENGLKISKNTVYSRVRQDLRKKRLRPRIALLSVPKPAPLQPEPKGNYRVPWHSQAINRILDSYITYKKEKSLREVGADIGSLYSIPAIKKEALKNHVLDRRRILSNVHGKGNFKRFNRLNFYPTDMDYFDLYGMEVCSSIDEWFNKPKDSVKWDQKYDEKMPERWFQKVREQLSKELPVQCRENLIQIVDSNGKKVFRKLRKDEEDCILLNSNQAAKNDEFNVNEASCSSIKAPIKLTYVSKDDSASKSDDVTIQNETEEARLEQSLKPKTIGGFSLPEEANPAPISQEDYKVRLIRHERQKFRSFIVEEKPGHFYHYIKNRTITAECSECREQWNLNDGFGIIGRLVISEKNSKVLEIISSHHENCRHRSEQEIRQIEIKRNVGDAVVIENDSLVYEKAEQMALLEIQKYQMYEENKYKYM